MKHLLIILLVGSLSYGDDAVHLNQGEVAPFEGLLLSIPKAQETRTRLIERDQFEAINSSLNNSINLYKANESQYQSQITTLLTQNDKLAKIDKDVSDGSTIKTVLTFLAGAAVTIGIAYAIRKVQ